LHDLSNSSLKVLCVNLWDNPAWIRRYAEKEAGDFLFTTRRGESASFVANVVKGRTMGYYVVNAAREAVYEIKGFPTTYVIDKDGRVVATHMGLVRWDNPSVIRWLNGLVDSESESEPVLENEYSLPAGLDHLLTVDLSKKESSGGGSVGAQQGLSPR